MGQAHSTAIITDVAGRYDIYGRIHKGLRRAQCELLVRMGSADFTSRSETADLIADVREYMELAAAHLHHEDEHIHAALRLHGAGVTEDLDHQHEDHRIAFADLAALLDSIEAAPAPKCEALGRRLYLAFSAYVARDLEHMLVEETDSASQLWSLFTDAELAAIEQRIVGSLPPEKAMAFMRLMIPAMNPEERASVLGGMRQDAPPEVFDAVLEFAARPHLSPAEFAALTERLKLAA